MLLSETIRKKESEEYSNAIGRFISESEEYYAWQRENADKPEEFVSEIDSRKDRMLSNILKDVKTPGARDKIINRFSIDFEQIRAGAAETSFRQSQTNKEQAFDINLTNAIDIPADTLLTESVVQNRIDSVIELIDENYGGVPDLMTPEQQKFIENEAFQSIISQYILQNAQSVDDIGKANQIARGFGVDPVFNANEIVKLRSSFQAQIRAQQRLDDDELKRIHGENSRQLIADYWDGKLNDPQVVSDALRNNLIDGTTAKYLYNGLTKSNPDKLDFIAYREVKESINDVGLGTKTVDEAYKVLMKNSLKLDKTTGKSLAAEIISEHNKADEEMKREARSLMEELIREKDPLSGMFKDDKLQILATAEAVLTLDKELEKAAEQGKPLERRDILIKAMEVGKMIIKRERLDEKQPTPEGVITHQISEKQPNRAGQTAYSIPSNVPIGTYNKEGSIILNERGVLWLRDYARKNGMTIEQARNFAKENNWIIQ